MNRLPESLLACLLTSTVVPAAPSDPPVAPNILFILADDMGYSDARCYGGEIDTPAIDRLAAEGLRFTQFRATPMCVTSRVAFLSGMSYQANGRMNYERSLPLPQPLRLAGYRTGIAGKWHASSGHPMDEGFFDRFFGFLGGMSDCYAGGPDWFDDRAPFTEFGPGFDATTRITDASLRYMGEALDEQQPFFMFVSYNAPHHPLQAQRETYEKYLGRYSAGFQAIREQRLARQREMGIIPPDFRVAPHTPEVRIWDELPPQRQKIEDQRMAAYAAMLDEMDQGIARILAFLEQRGVLDHTVVIFASDNGGYFNTGDPQTHGKMKPWLPRSNQSVGSDWGWVQNTPFNHFKQTAFEGGLAVPFIVRYPPALAGRAGEMTSISADFTDLYPTFLHLAGATRPAVHDGQPLKPLTGKNFWPALVDGADFTPPERFHWFQPSRALIQGDDKVVSIHDGPWQLFNLASDRGETTDLSSVQPELCQRLADRWHAYAESIGMSPGDRRPALPHPHAWGWHRLQMVLPRLVAIFPENGMFADPGLDRLEMIFAEPLDFTSSAGKRIHLYAVSDEENPVWDIPLAPDHPAQGGKTLRVEGLPPLEPDTQYYLIIPPAAFQVGGKPAGRVNDGAYWWRFRTRPAG